MARLSTTTERDPFADVLFSIAKGEQIEYQTVIKGLDNMEQFEYEAVVVEANNELDQTQIPKSIKTAGAQTVLNVRVPNDRGAWLDTEEYDAGDMVSYGTDRYYVLKSGTAYSNIDSPASDDNWSEVAHNIIYVQIPATLASDWALQPTVNVPCYGFFEVRVSEPAGTLFTHTWKPIRGTIKVFFSPTDVVPDV